MNNVFFDRAISDLMIADGLVTHEQLERLLGERENATEPVADMLVRVGLLSDRERARYLGRQLGTPFISLTARELDPAVVRLLTSTMCMRLDVLPVERSEAALSVAMANPLDIAAIDEMRAHTGLEIDPLIATREEIQEAIGRIFGAYDTLEALIREAKGSLAAGEARGEAREEDSATIYTVDDTRRERAPIIQLVNEILLRAVSQRASDIHLNPEKARLRVRFRIDGLLHEVISVPHELQNVLISRLKIMAGMDVAEHRAPQDGRIALMVMQGELDCRVSSYPSLYGENLVLRLLDKRNACIGLENLGMLAPMQRELEKLIQRPHGMILVCGPTGSGKTTTLYACLNALTSETRNIMTIEDPVEYQLPGIIQGNVNPKAGITFATGLRTLVRQDPDIILVGEIRDAETARIAIEAALTGHLVFSTIHANDAAGAITRLIDMGIEPFLIASSLMVSLNQRLLRLVCERCAEPFQPLPGALKALSIPEAQWEAYATLQRGQGCDRCGQSGYRGRMGSHEMMVMSEALQSLILAKAPSHELKSIGLQKRPTLRDDALQKMRQGKTTPEEVLRVTVI